MDRLRSLLTGLFALPGTGGPVCGTGDLLAGIDPGTAASLLSFFEGLSDPTGRLHVSQQEPAGFDAHLTWPHRGTYYTQSDGREHFLYPQLRELLSRKFDSFLQGLLMLALADAGSECPAADMARFRLIRQNGQRILDPLVRAQESVVQVWLEPRAVLETHYGVTLDRVPVDFYPEIAACGPQCREWVRLYAIDRVTASPTGCGYSEPLTTEFLRQNPHLMLDTRCFPPDFVERLSRATGLLDDQLDGLLIHGDNFGGLRLLETLGKSVDCICTDPPYNTGGTDLPYPDRYARSSWLTMMENRFRIAHRLLAPGGACFVSIDENEQAALELLLSEIFGPEDHVASLVWEAGRKNDSRLVSVSHEYMLCYVKRLADPVQKGLTWRVRKDGLDEIYAKGRALLRRYGRDTRRASVQLRRWFAGLPDNHPAKRHRHYCCVDERGVYHPGNISWPGGGGPTYEVLHPVTGRPCKVPSRGWMYPTAGRMQEAIRQGLVHFGEDENRVPCAKVYLHTNEHHAPSSVFYRDGRAAMKRLRDMLGQQVFANPKDETVIAERIRPAMPGDGTVLDPFAGSGSTAHAVMLLNRADGGRRRYILMERADSFDPVLLTRIQRAAYSRRWRRGLPVDREGCSHAFKCIRLESFEAALARRPPLRAAGESTKRKRRR